MHAIRNLFHSSEPRARAVEEAKQRLDESVKNTLGTGEVRRRLAEAYRDFADALRGDEGVGR